MSEDVKKENPLEESGENAPQEENIAEELEQLRDTFQEKYDETVAEAEEGPVIQELDGAAAEPEENTEDGEEEAPAESAPAKKKMKKGKKAIIAVIVLVLVLVFGALIAYFVASVSNPNFNALISSMSKASSAESYEEKMSAYEEALGYCDGESKMQAAMKSTILDDMFEAAYKEKGFDAAYSLMQENLSEEELAASSSKTVKTIKKVIAAADEIADGSLDAAIAAYAENKDVAAETVAAGFSVPSEISEDINSAISYELKALAALDGDSGIESSSEAVGDLNSAYTALTGAGAEEQDLAEKMAVTLYKNNYILCAMSMSNALIDPSAEAINQDYSDMKADLADFSGMDVSVYALASKAVSGGTDDFAKLVADNTKLTGAKAALIADLTAFCADGIKAEKEKNLSKAVASFVNTMGIADMIGVSDSKVTFKAVSLMVQSGNFAELQTYDAVLTDEVTEALSAAEQAEVKKIHSIYKALESSSQVFSEYYMNYAYYGSAIDYKAACDDLDATITAESTNYDRGFVAYCKYFAAMYSDNKQDFEKLINEMKKEMPDLKTVYGYYLIDLYKEEKNIGKALEVAKDILKDNIGDDYANSVVAFAKRVNGDVDGALEAALKGMELSGVDGYCLSETGINYMIKGDYENAFTYVKKMYETTRTLESCELVLICNALYNGTDSEVKEELASLAAEVNDLYANYGAASYTDTTAVISGEKTLADVYLKDPYTLQGEPEVKNDTEAETTVQ